MKLRSVTANKDHFRPVSFRDGLNVVLAERTETSRETDSRNGVGKTTLFQIIDFCLGGQVRGADGLGKLSGSDWQFSLSLAFGSEHELTVTRALDDAGDIHLSGAVIELGLGDASPGSIRARAWTNWLGQRCFDLSSGDLKGEYDPTFRRLFGHFLRFRADAYVSPFEIFGKQPPHQTQVDNAYLMGLNWQLAVEWQRWKDRNKTLGALAKNDIEELAERLGELESRRVRVESQRRRLAQQLKDFEVLPEYREIEARANRATSRMQALANEMTISARLLELYQQQLTSETADEAAAVLEVFREAGVVFGDVLQRSLEEIVDFHAQVAKNRHDYLQAEILRIEAAQHERAEEVQQLEDNRREDLSLLETHGALEDFAQLQQRLGSAAATSEALGQQIEDLREIRRGKAAQKLAQVELQQRTALDVDERLPSVASILENFSETFESLYGEAADLVVDVGEAGYQFRVSLPMQGSHGVGKVGVFAYDVAVTNDWARKGRGVGFLAHDSIIFDGVDERQIASGIRRAMKFADELDYQYVITMNSDDLPTAQLETYEIDVADVTVITLTDSDPSGGLLGIRV